MPARQDNYEEIVTLAVNRKTIKVIEDFAASLGLDTSAYINSVPES
jgi:hypothetical protein